MKPLFTLGHVVATPCALAAIEKSGRQPGDFLARHVSGDWGEVPPEDIEENDFSLKHGFRLLSAYHTSAGQKSGTPWLVLWTWATASSEYFAACVRNPQARNPHARMPGNSSYNNVTIDALTTYFQTFSPTGGALLLRRTIHGRGLYLKPARIVKRGATKERKTMTLRIAKLALVFAVALFYSLVVLNNTTDYNSNFQFVRHVLMMDSTFPANRGMWRTVNSPVWHSVFYLSIIASETVTPILCWWGRFLMARALQEPTIVCHRAKRVAISALTVSLLMWFVVFLSVGGEWFLMWQSKMWNGQDAAFRMFTVIGIILLFVVQPETEPSMRDSR